MPESIDLDKKTLANLKKKIKNKDLDILSQNQNAEKKAAAERIMKRLTEIDAAMPIDAALPKIPEK